MNQMDMNFSTERAARREGMKRAEDRANREIADWSDLALQFLTNYSRANEMIFAEDVTKAAEVWGMIAPENPRAWGGVYVRAQHAGVIEKTSMTRARANGSLAVIYRSCIFKRAA